MTKESDRELLELAAKAGDVALVQLERWIEDSKGFYINGPKWNALYSYGDALRLQIKLKIGLVPDEDGGWSCVTWDHDDEVALSADPDPKRAIVLAAANIAKGMP